MTEHEGALSFIDQESDDDHSEFMLKKPERSNTSVVKNMFKKRQVKGMKVSKAKEQFNIDTKSSTILPSLNVDEIPSAAAIHAARKKREMARNSTVDVEIMKTKTDVVTDDENSDDEAVESCHVRQFGVSHDTPKQMEVLSAMDNASSGSDEERFVEEQICKGVYTFSLPTASVRRKHLDVSSDVCDEKYSTKSTVPSIPISIESLQSQLHSQLTLLNEHKSTNKTMLDKLVQDMQTADSEVIALERHSQILSVQYQFFQEIGCYIKDLLQCLTEKVVYSAYSIKFVQPAVC